MTSVLKHQTYIRYCIFAHFKNYATTCLSKCFFLFFCSVWVHQMRALISCSCIPIWYPTNAQGVVLEYVLTSHGRRGKIDSYYVWIDAKRLKLKPKQSSYMFVFFSTSRLNVCAYFVHPLPQPRYQEDTQSICIEFRNHIRVLGRLCATSLGILRIGINYLCSVSISGLPWTRIRARKWPSRRSHRSSTRFTVSELCAR